MWDEIVENFSLMIRNWGYLSFGLFWGWAISRIFKRKDDKMFVMFLVMMLVVLFVFLFTTFMEFIGRIF